MRKDYTTLQAEQYSACISLSANGCLLPLSATASTFAVRNDQPGMFMYSRAMKELLLHRSLKVLCFRNWHELFVSRHDIRIKVVVLGLASEEEVLGSICTESRCLQSDRLVEKSIVSSVPFPDGFVHLKRCFTAAGVARMEVNLWYQRTGSSNGSTFRNTAHLQTHQSPIALLLPPLVFSFSSPSQTSSKHSSTTIFPSPLSIFHHQNEVYPYYHGLCRRR